MASSHRSALICLFILQVLIAFGESCKVKLNVPSELGAEELVGRVNLEKCVKSNSVIAISKDPGFSIIEGALYTRHAMTLSSKRKITILIQDMETLDQSKLHVVLVPLKKESKKRSTREAILKRTKRRWRPLPFSIMENAIPPFPQFVQQIQSDTQENYTIYYSISGQGVDMPPVNLFYIKAETGEIFVTRTIDREEYQEFKLMGYATTRDKYSPETPLDIIIKIDDDNDNAPVFTEDMFCMNIGEHRVSGTIVGRVNATDRDEPGSIHTKLKYSIISQFPAQPKMFSMNPETGVIITTSDGLDREVMDTFKLLIQVSDMDGLHHGLTSTGSVTIRVTDENDHAPTFLAPSYQVEVNENECGIDILRIPVEDKDLVNTENWRANFTITQGNEQGYFSIRTDPTTNEGILSVVRSLNYEEMNQIDLRIGVVNQAVFVKVPSKQITMNTIPVKVIVKDVDEGPEFQPQVKYIRTQEGLPAGTEIGEYIAKDPENKNTNIRYQKITDVYSWITIAPTTGKITTNKVLDRESGEMQHDYYNVTVHAIDDSGKTGTGTLVIQLVDVNDNQPEITQNDGFICMNGKNYAEIHAKDADGSPNSAPLKFSLDTTNNPDIQKQWQIQQLSDTSMRLIKIGDISGTMYDVPILILDQQGYGRTHSVKIDVCECPDRLNCAAGRRAARNVSLGVWAILAMILAALVLLALLCALLACLCGSAANKHGKAGFPDDLAQENLIVSNTEAPGEELMDPNVKIPIQVINANRSGQGVTKEIQQVITSPMNQNQTTEYFKEGHNTLTVRPGQQMDQGRYAYSEWHSFMQSHINGKVYQYGQEEEHQPADDYVVPYNYEGRGSLAGSVGCCSELRGEDDRLDFLNQLEPKFRTLASVCARK
ncbi:desmocollin-1 [Microcaecilia unicolor]|uniref:Desmocollin-1-like n=1 Tax=Microcaecilia unicolor TaxID=1415580 RepID=A0A6P7Z2E6_9AMPH|nr:desmocollin-1-like [Microcaecilia unicolor]